MEVRYLKEQTIQTTGFTPEYNITYKFTEYLYLLSINPNFFSVTINLNPYFCLQTCGVQTPLVHPVDEMHRGCIQLERINSCPIVRGLQMQNLTLVNAPDCKEC